MIDWLNAQAAQEFGTSLAHFYMECIPLRPPSGKPERTARRNQEVFEKMTLRLASFKQQNKLNIYKKAKLGNAFKWTLQEAGYPAEIVDELTQRLMLSL